MGGQSEMRNGFGFLIFFVRLPFYKESLGILSCFIIYASDSDAEMNENCHAQLWYFLYRQKVHDKKENCKEEFFLTFFDAQRKLQRNA